MRPAWAGIAGWLLILAAFIIAAVFVPWPLNGLTLLAFALGVAGAWLVNKQLDRNARETDR